MKRRTSLRFKPESAAGIVSISAFGLYVIAMISIYVYSVICHGKAGVIAGVLCVGSLLFSVIGIGSGVNGILKKDFSHRLSAIGLILNIISIMATIGLYIFGIMILL